MTVLVATLHPSRLVDGLFAGGGNNGRVVLHLKKSVLTKTVDVHMPGATSWPIFSRWLAFEGTMEAFRNFQLYMAQICQI